MTTPDEVRAALADVEDPELPISVVDLGLVRGVSVSEEGAVTVRMTFTSIACPCTDLLKEDVARRVGGLDGVADVVVEEVFEAWTRDDVSEEGREILRALAVV
jgi:metal-sulfur cluster biosynthetic enzyme